MKKKIHVNQHNIKYNSKENIDKKPVLTCKNYKENKYGNNIKIYDKDGYICAEIIYSPEKPLNCGAKVWIETENKIEIT